MDLSDFDLADWAARPTTTLGSMDWHRPNASVPPPDASCGQQVGDYLITPGEFALVWNGEAWVGKL